MSNRVRGLERVASLLSEWHQTGEPRTLDYACAALSELDPPEGESPNGSRDRQRSESERNPCVVCGTEGVERISVHGECIIHDHERVPSPGLPGATWPGGKAIPRTQEEWVALWSRVETAEQRVTELEAENAFRLSEIERLVRACGCGEGIVCDRHYNSYRARLAAMEPVVEAARAFLPSAIDAVATLGQDPNGWREAEELQEAMDHLEASNSSGDTHDNQPNL